MDSSSLPADVAAELDDAVQALLSAGMGQVGRVRDAAVLEFKFEKGGKVTRARFDETAAPKELDRVLRILRPLLKPIPFQAD
ncbi:hypothetical protein GR702_20820 [Novosphingobium sp. FGD1]|uniref:Uncharacterized protein n=1 Tax=Novosphingobium silvae TaxID=2692619 RepID=A0A7X4GK77_9SPHN|nr:hypothetical protein [Novosphingobium silvae]MYM00199.1 hypothetical protein [Novosphingobium silvae]